MKEIYGSFRDPCGRVYEDDGKIIRTVEKTYITHWCAGADFLEKMGEEGLIIPFEEIESPFENTYKVLHVTKIPFISYPYEWCFSQLQDAAMLLLLLQGQALKNGLIMKDASAYNIQFIGTHPIFIDILSFEKYAPGQPWGAYRQFCSHFLAPLALMSYGDLRCNSFLKLWIDGLPLDFAATLLPYKACLNLGLLWHIFLHANMQKRHADVRTSAAKAKKVNISPKALEGLAISLENTIKKLHLPKQKTEWENYYTDTNYSDEATNHKIQLIEQYAQICSGTIAIDMGANTGRFSKLLAPHFELVIAADIDPLAVERHYCALKEKKIKSILPIILDLTNPSPGIGFANKERSSFSDRCNADFMVALALIHHLAITGGITLEKVAEYFADLIKPHATLVLEFVPKEDSQVQRLLSVREDCFANYHIEGCRAAFSRFFLEKDSHIINGSMRTLLIFQKL